MRFLISILILVCAVRAEVGLPNLTTGQRLSAGHRLAEESLSDHMVSQLASRTNGNTDQFSGVVAGGNYFFWPLTNNGSFWLRDVTNIFAQSKGTIEPIGNVLGCANYFTPISARICVGAAHPSPSRPPGQTNIWVLPDGTHYTNKSIAVANCISNFDLQFMLMERTNWTVVRVFPNDTNRIRMWKSRTNSTSPPFVAMHQGIGRSNQFHTSLVLVCNEEIGWVSGSPTGGFPGQFSFGDYSLGYGMVGGDSSGAMWGIVNNEALLVGTWSSSHMNFAIARQAALVNATMAALCQSNGLPVESITIADLSRFPRF
jgi:hypothetical protein